MKDTRIDDGKRIYKNRDEIKHDSRKLYSLSEEISLATNLMDILDELSSISAVISDQKGVAKDIDRAFNRKEKSEAGDEMQENEIELRILQVEKTVEKLSSSASHEYAQVRAEVSYL